MADVHSKPLDPRCGLRAQLAETDLRVEFHRHHQHVFIGTRLQLERENLAPPDGKWPNGRDSVRWVSGSFRYSLALEYASNLKRLYGQIPEQVRFRLRVEPQDGGYAAILHSQLLEKLDEMYEIKYRGTRDHYETFMKRCEAQRDAWFQDKLAQIVKETQPRKGGRPRDAR